MTTKLSVFPYTAADLPMCNKDTMIAFYVLLAFIIMLGIAVVIVYETQKKNNYLLK